MEKLTRVLQIVESQGNRPFHIKFQKKDMHIRELFGYDSRQLQFKRLKDSLSPEAAGMITVLDATSFDNACQAFIDKNNRAMTNDERESEMQKHFRSVALDRVIEIQNREGVILYKE